MIRTTTMIMNIIAIMLAVLAIMLAVTAPPVPARGTPVRPSAPPACQVEDGGPIPCVWEAPHRGGRQEPIPVLITEAP